MIGGSAGRRNDGTRERQKDGTRRRSARPANRGCGGGWRGKEDPLTNGWASGHWEHPPPSSHLPLLADPAAAEGRLPE